MWYSGACRAEDITVPRVTLFRDARRNHTRADSYKHQMNKMNSNSLMIGGVYGLILLFVLVDISKFPHGSPFLKPATCVFSARN